MKKWWKALFKKPCPWMLRYLDRHGSDYLVSYISDRANTVALVISMRILDQERIAHCHVCPSRFEMRKKDGVYFCKRHAFDKNLQPRVPIQP